MVHKPYRMYVRVKDGKPREPNKLKGLLVPHVDVIDAKDRVEFFVHAVKEAHLDQVRAKLSAAGLEEAPVPERRDPFPKPYGFVSLPEKLTSSPPIWHDGTNSKNRLAGEIRFELKTLTPLLVGWERGQVGDEECDWPVPATLPNIGQLAHKKSVLCPLRAPWGKRPVIIPGDSLKGLLRHEVGALLGAPMERVAERSYSYRPNALFPKDPNPRLIARIARVPSNAIEMQELDDKIDDKVRVPTKLELMPTNLRYDKSRNRNKNYYRFDDGNGGPYRGGRGAGDKLNSKRKLHNELTVNASQPIETVDVPKDAQDGYLATLRHLVDLDHGHFSERHPDVPNTVKGEDARKRILEAAKNVVFQPGDMIWVEWDTEKECIVSLGWHYYYRWAYVDSVRKRGGRLERHGLFPLDEERSLDGTEQDKHRAPKELSAVRRLFGYTGDNEGSQGIGKGDYSQLMGRIFVNAALEVVGENESDDDRFLKPTFLKELGMPRPSAVEHYLKQPYHPQSRPSDRATLVTYGDAAGYDAPGELAGRKFYLDRSDAYGTDGKGLVPGPAEDASEANRINERSTLALEASKPGRRFRFTVRFRDLDACEVAAILIALSPEQFKDVLGGTHPDGYCSKLGYARPLGWGSVRIEARALLLLDEASDPPTLNPEPDLHAWVKNNYQQTSTQDEWLAIHRCKHPDAADYPRAADRDGNENIYTFHSKLRAEHSRNRRYTREDR